MGDMAEAMLDGELCELSWGEESYPGATPGRPTSGRGGCSVLTEHGQRDSARGGRTP